MTLTKEIVMKAEISRKLAALGVALMMNSLIIGGVAYLFNGQIHQKHTISLAHSSVQPSAAAVRG
jgi:hypothetical protein